MTFIEMEKLINIAAIFGVGAVVGGSVLILILKKYIPAYLSEKGKNLATKEDVEEITNKVEQVKSNYSEILEEIRTSNQIKLSSIDREQNIKKEVYMDAVEAITKSLAVISNFSNLNVSEGKITSVLSDQEGKVAKVQIVGSPETVEAVTILIGEVSTKVLELLSDRAPLANRKHEIELLGTYYDKCQDEISRYIEMLTNLNLEGNTDANVRSRINRQIDFEYHKCDEYKKKMNELQKIQNVEYNVYIEKCMASFFSVSEFLPKVVLSVRKELGLDISNKEYLDIHNKNVKKGKVIFNKFLEELNIKKEY